MAIFYYFGEISKDNRMKIFATGWSDVLITSSFADGVVVAEPDVWGSGNHGFWDYAELVASCFEEGSNFKEMLLKAYEKDENTPFEVIRFVYDGVLFNVSKENADPDKLYDFWEAELKALNAFYDSFVDDGEN